MKYTKSYLLVQSLRAQGETYKSISKNLGISYTTVNRLLNNKGDVSEKTDKRVIEKFDKNYSNTQKGNVASGLYLFYKDKRSKYDIIRVSKRMKKEGVNQKEIVKKSKIIASDDTEVNKSFYEMLKQGWIEISEVE